MTHVSGFRHVWTWIVFLFLSAVLVILSAFRQIFLNALLNSLSLMELAVWLSASELDRIFSLFDKWIRIRTVFVRIGHLLRCECADRSYSIELGIVGFLEFKSLCKFLGFWSFRDFNRGFLIFKRAFQERLVFLGFINDPGHQRHIGV